MTARYRGFLPQLTGQPFLTDGGLETTLVFLQGYDLPDFAAFPLLLTEAGRADLLTYYRTYIDLAARHSAGLILESPTWRASADWARRLGYSRPELAQANRDAITLLHQLREQLMPLEPVVISASIGPRGDGYIPNTAMTIREAAAYHAEQAHIFARTPADMLSAMTINYAAEAAGIAIAARYASMPVAISFTVETDGCLATGQPLGEAIREVDSTTGSYPTYYMINCAHPDHFAHALPTGARWLERIRGLRANASCKSHAELNESTTLDPGDPHKLAFLYARLLHGPLPNLTILGGCCGTDDRHVEAIASACLPALEMRTA
ncbi:MAG: homocysteine S-methyltransferase family protein [Acidobacteria bacterium]|nr:homocysteine S-methyltransferase family protein [Acidobacteriota bacterium]